MKSRPTDRRYLPSSTDFRQLLLCKRWLLPLICLGSLTACMASPSYQTDLPPDSSPADSSATYSQSPSATPSLALSPSPSSQFNFPMTSCGDRAAQPSESWYSVFIDGASLDDIRTRYCGDAVSVTRAKSGKPTVQAASFTSYARALTLAKAIGGVVEQATAAAENSPQPAQSPAASSPAPAPTPATTAQIGQSAYLNASQSGVPINIRSTASTSAQVQSMGYAGDPVQIASSAQGDDGFTWYEIKLASGTTGWVRGDLVSAQAQAQAQAQAPTQSAPDYANSDDAQPPSYSQVPAQPNQTPYQQPYNQAPGQPPYALQPNQSQDPYNQAPGQSPYGQLPSQQPYDSQPYGQPPSAQPPSNRPYAQAPYGQPDRRGGSSTLTSREPGSAINIREFASLNSQVRYRANPGDPVQVSGSAQGDDGFTWYQVRFSSGAAGWVRGDLLAGS